MDARMDTLILAGCGAMGGAFLKLGGDFLSHFRHVVIVDERRTPSARNLPAGNGWKFVCGDIEDADLLKQLAGRAEGSFLLVNLCDGTDNYLLRSHVAARGGAYIDTSASSLRDSNEVRLSRLMPRTVRRTVNILPHFVCCGINPGMVELIARREITRCFPESDVVDIELYEYDGFACSVLPPGKVAVAWSPSTLVDEVMLTPGFELRGGAAFERPARGAACAAMRWAGEETPVRLVAHEEIWNMQFLSNVRVGNCFFAYGFRDEVMNTLAGDPADARRAVMTPEPDMAVSGEDSVILKIADRRTGRCRAWAWCCNHADIYDLHGVNAVQYQVCASLLVFCELLMASLDRAESMAYTASTLPLEWFPVDAVDSLLKKYGVMFQPCEHVPLLVRSYNGAATR